MHCLLFLNHILEHPETIFSSPRYGTITISLLHWKTSKGENIEKSCYFTKKGYGVKISLSLMNSNLGLDFSNSR